MPDKDELFKGIDSAADNLFDQYIVKKTASTVPEATPEPEEELVLELETEATSAPSESESAPQAESHSEVEEKLEIETTPAQAEPEIVADGSKPDGNDQLFDELTEALLTIDWEVSQESITKGRDLLIKLVNSQGWTPATQIGQVTEQMDKVLASMLESPENSPTSAPSQLKNALQAIKAASNPEGITSATNINKSLETASSNLQALLTSGTSTETHPSPNLSDDLQAATPIESIPQPTEEPSFDLGLEMSSDDTPDDQPSLGETIPKTTVDTLKSYDAAIVKSIKLITPMENLFASRPAMAKLHSASKKIRSKLASQHELLGTTFSSDYSSYNGVGTVHGWLESQLDVLKDSVNRISKIEKLFAKTAGYEKLFTRSKKIRITLEKQVDAITVAVGGTPTQHQFDLTGEYPAVLQPEETPQTPEAPAAVVSAVASPEEIVDKCIGLAKSIELNTTDNPQASGQQIRESLEKLRTAISGSAIHSPAATAAATAAISAVGHSSKCRWDWLLKTSWGGQLVGIAPEQVAFESKTTYPVKSFKDVTFFNLKKLQSMPWTNLQGLFSGELAELDKSALSEMELEIANPPASFPGSSKKKVHLIILYTEGRGRVYLIDSPTEAISVSEEALWAPDTSAQSDIAGTLTVYGSTMPVISID